MSIEFVKMQGLGNDYIYIVADKCPHSCGNVVRRLSDRHFGVGGDGVIFILPPENAAADVRMRMFNSDGTEAEMCGNAVRCVGKLAYESGLARRNPLRVATGAGIKVLELLLDGRAVTGARVDMGAPGLAPEAIPLAQGAVSGKVCVAHPLTLDGAQLKLTAVSMGNPHAVLFVDDVDSTDVHGLGARLERHPLFPRRTNVEFVQLVDRHSVRMRVWERGAGETLACGTGACAATVACVLNGLAESPLEVRLPGGTLQVEWERPDGHVFMTGPAVQVFSGVWPERGEAARGGM